jgi:hypothetical protein
VVTGQTSLLANGVQFTIEVSEAFHGTRFIIHTTPAASTIATATSCHAMADGSIDVSVPSSDWNVSLSAQSGYEFMAQGSVTFDHLQAGEYLLQVDHATCGISSEVISIEEPAQIRTVITGTESVECNAGSSGMFTFEVENANWFTYEVRNAQNELVRSANVEGQTAIVEGLSANLYSLHVFTPCSNESVEVDLRDEQANSLVVDQLMLANENNQITAYINATLTQPGVCVWNFSNGIQVTGNEVELTMVPEEVVSYTVTCDGICDVSATGAIQAISLSNEEIESSAKITFTQSNNGIQLQFGNAESRQVDARMYDAQGRLIESASFVMSAGATREWSTDNLSKGVYTLVLSNEGNAFFTQKFVK